MSGGMPGLGSYDMGREKFQVMKTATFLLMIALSISNAFFALENQRLRYEAETQRQCIEILTTGIRNHIEKMTRP